MGEQALEVITRQHLIWATKDGKISDIIKEDVKGQQK